MRPKESGLEDRGFQVTSGYAYYVFILLFLLYVFNCVDRTIVAALFPYLKAELMLTDTECGWFASVVTLMMTIFVFPISLLIDRWSRKNAIGIMGLVWGAASVACAFAKSFFQLLFLRSFVGIGEAAFTAGGTALISAYFKEDKRATMNGIFTAAVPLGTALGIIIGGVIAVKFGWRYAFGIMAIPGIIVAVVFFWVRDYKTVAIIRKVAKAGSYTHIKIGFRDIVKEFLNTPSVLMTYLGYVGNTFVVTGLTYWLPTYYHRTEGLPMDKAGIKTSAIFLLAIVGAPLGGIITDRVRKKWINARMSIPAITSLLSAIFAFAGFSFGGQSQYLLLFMVGLTLPMFAAGAAAVTQDVVHPGLRAISYSLAQFLMMLLSYTLSPVFVGAISDHYDLLTAFKLLPLFALFSSMVFFIGSFYYKRDLDKVERITLEEI